jgi:hypothetical protein
MWLGSDVPPGVLVIFCTVVTKWAIALIVLVHRCRIDMQSWDRKVVQSLSHVGRGPGAS